MKRYEKHPYDRVYAVVHLDHIRYNVKQMRDSIPKETGLCGVVKTDAYGHGAAPVAKAMDEYVMMYAVATVDEGIILRRHGITKPILVLGVTPPSRYMDLLKNGIMPTIFTCEQAEQLEEKAEWLGFPIQVHLAVDTGMGRIGIDCEAEGAVQMACKIAAQPLLSVSGMFTHFATADEADKSFTWKQLDRFTAFAQALEEAGLQIPVRHCGNSAAIVEGIGTNWDMMRAGISIYGIYPSGDVSRERVHLQPAMELKACVSHVKTVAPGTHISYGATFTAEQEMQVATIPVGYGDGYPRALSNHGWVLIQGRKCPILGRVCMDQFMVDVSGMQVQAGEIATLLGQDGNEEITLADFEAAGGCFSYEVLCGIGKRVPRVYMDEEGICGLQDWNKEIYEDFVS